MTHQHISDEKKHEAVEWFVRLQECDDEAVWLAHFAWLESDPANAEAYASVEALWVDFDEAGPTHDDRGSAQNELPSAQGAEIIELDAHPRARARWRKVWLPAAVAAAVAALIAAPQISGFLDNGTTYRSDGEHIREIALADGSSLTLNRNSEITVEIGRDLRSATLVSGEVAFDIHHENDRPFVVTAGDREIRVLGTEFNVMRQNGAFAVTVRRGLVAVSTADDPARQVRLPAGHALVHPAGASADKLSVVSADDTFAWRTGKLVYVDRPLADVANDLSRYIGVPVEVAPEVRALRITGVLKIGDERSLREQVEALLPVKLENASGGRRLIAARSGR